MNDFACSTCGPPHERSPRGDVMCAACIRVANAGGDPRRFLTLPIVETTPRPRTAPPTTRKRHRRRWTWRPA